MVVGIMQPYFFPYMGYFQLILHSDVFVFHDDVQYIKGGWVNRNRILSDNRLSWITFPVCKASHDRPINERRYVADERTRNRLLRRIAAAYRSAPFFKETYPLVQEIMSFADTNVATFNVHLASRIAAHLNICTPILLSSTLPTSSKLTGQERVIEICRCLSATHYVNASGGRKLYARGQFSRAGIELGFLEAVAFGDTKPRASTAPLSILHDLMTKETKTLMNDLRAYRIAP